MSFFSSSAFSTCKFFIITILCVIVQMLHFSLSLQASSDDSTSLYIVKPIVKVADSSSFLLINGKYSFKKSLSNELQGFLGNSRLQAISMLIPSIELRDYGGPGALNLFSIRGLGPLRNVILLDGIPLTSSQSGLFDISSIAMFPGQSIEMDMGGGSSIIGSGAMSGILDISMNSLTDTSFASISGGIGSFGEEIYRIGGGIANNSTSFMVNTDHLSFDGTFPIRFQPTGNVPTVLVERGNAGNSKMNVFARVSHHCKEEKLKATFWTSFVNGDRGVPGAVLTGKIEDSEASFGDQDFMIAGNVNAIVSNRSTINVKTSLRTSWSYFRDPFALYAGNEGAKYVFSTKELFSQAELLLMPSHEIIIKSGAVFAHADLRGELLQPFAGDNPTRTTGALFTRWMMNIEEHDIDAGLRLDAFSDQQGPAFSGHLAIAQEILSGYTISGKVTRDFRVPSFNELYYLNYGTQFLKPETSMGIDIGCSYDEGDVKGEISIYHMQVKDQILAMPISPVQWRASNIGMVWSSGIEASFGHKISIINGAIQCNYAFKHVIDKSPESDTYESSIPYVPKHTFSSTLISTFSTHSLGIMVTAIGERYGMLGELPESKMNPVILVNPHAELRMRLLDGMLRIRGEIRNLLNEEYQMILNFPLPGRSYIISMGYDL